MAGPCVSVAQGDDGIAVVTFEKEPVNSMDKVFVSDLLAAVKACEASSARALIFRSGLKRNIFTSGLDIRELYAPMTTRERVEDFFGAVSTALLAIYRTPLVTVAAISGACPAGGCILALCCDYRIITADGTMGLNEVQLGIPVPPFWCEVFAATVGRRQAELSLLAGDLYQSARLVEMGLVDQRVVSATELMPAAREACLRLLAPSDLARAATKKALRDGLAQRWEAGKVEEAAGVWRTVNRPETVVALRAVLESLSAPRRASKL